MAYKLHLASWKVPYNVAIVQRLPNPKDVREVATAWDLPDSFNPGRVDIPRYSELLEGAVDMVLEPIMEKVGGNELGQLRLDL